MSGAAILILTTGGTVDKAYFDALSEYQITDSGVPALLQEARVAVPFRVVELMRKDSLDLMQADRRRGRGTAPPRRPVRQAYGSR